MDYLEALAGLFPSCEAFFFSGIQWKCQYEDALIQPKRPVLDINTGEYADNHSPYRQ